MSTHADQIASKHMKELVSYPWSVMRFGGLMAKLKPKAVNIRVKATINIRMYTESYEYKLKMYRNLERIFI
jgi:hypothetical protein